MLTNYEKYAMGGFPSFDKAFIKVADKEPKPDGLRPVTCVIDEMIVHAKQKHASELYTPEVIMQNEKRGGYYTTVKWNDGTYTTVKASGKDERSVYTAFCAALAKKIFGSNCAVHRTVDRHTNEYIEAQKKKSNAEKRAKAREAEQAAHERALLREAKRLRLKEEAKEYNRAHRYED